MQLTGRHEANPADLATWRALAERMQQAAIDAQAITHRYPKD